MADQGIELARQEGTTSRCVRLYARENGGLTFEGQDLGTRVQEIWGDSDYEFWVDVPAAALQKLAFELLREKYTGRLDAVDAFRAWCKTHGIDHEFTNYA